MEKTDYSIELEEEFYEDFGINLPDKELNEFLILARKESNAKLRIFIKKLAIRSIYNEAFD